VMPLIVCGDSRVQVSEQLLAEADRVAILYDWPKAASLYDEAGTLFHQAGDEKNAVQARLGYVWATAESGSSPAISQEVARQFQNSFVRDDPRLMLRALIAKAVVD